MKLLTKELVKKCEEYPLYSQEGKSGDAKVIAKFFNPTGQGTWLITEGDVIRDEQGNIEDVEMFGFVNLVGMDCAELGYVSLNELQSIRLPLFGLTIERDLYYPEDINLRDACKKEFGEVPDMFMAKARYAVYQLKHNEENHFLKFTGLSQLKNGIDDIKATNYDKVYEGNRDAVDMEDGGETFYACESLFRIFNTDEMPSDFTGHSLSVSDVIVLECDGVSKAYYCDTFGFKEIPSFIKQLKNVSMNINIKEWYMEQYPDDELGEILTEPTTFLDLNNLLNAGYGDVYSLLGIGDSVVRERCFEKLSEITNQDYGIIYDKWLNLKDTKDEPDITDEM